jgi:ketosteroid isomerase-like protein
VTAPPAPHPALDWLDRFAAAVRTGDISAADGLFADDVVGYGTRAARAVGLPELQRQQWGPVWSATQGFAFEHPDAVFAGADPSAPIVILARWSSYTKAGDARAGRSTIVLTSTEGGPLRCIHSHFSLDPEDGGRIA